MNNFDALTERQKEVAEAIVDNAIERKKDKTVSKLTQAELGELVGVTDRTVRNWSNDILFLEYVEYLSRVRLQAAMPDFVAVLIQNLEKGENVSTKQLDLIAKVADWLPDKKSKDEATSISYGHASSIEERIRRIEDRKREEVDVTPKVADDDE